MGPFTSISSDFWANMVMLQNVLVNECKILRPAELEGRTANAMISEHLIMASPHKQKALIVLSTPL